MSGLVIMLILAYGLTILIFVFFYLGPYTRLKEQNNVFRDSFAELDQQFEVRVKERTQDLENVRDEVSAYAIQRYELAQELEYKNAEITQQKDLIFKQSEKLKEAYDEIKKLDGYKRRMAAMIVHDLKNPINVILNLTDSNAIPEKPGTIIRQLSYEMLDLILNILEVQKFEELGMKIEEENILLGDLLRDSIENLSYLLKNSSLSMSVSVHDSLIIISDRHILKRIFGNLISNSIKHTPSGGRIEIRSIIKQNELLIEVTDTGCGISEENIDKVFELYNKSSDSNALKNSSTGIGLAYCRMGIEALGGNIGIISKPDHGTTVWFTLKHINSTNLNLADEGVSTMLISPKIANLTKSDIELLRPYVEQLKYVDLCEITKILELLNHDFPDSNERLSKWKRELEESVFAADERRYRQLLGICFPELISF